jgi:hypothetical protein
MTIERRSAGHVQPSETTAPKRGGWRSRRRPGLMARRFGVAAVAAVGVGLAAGPPAAQAWYPNGLTLIRNCGDPIPAPNTPLTAVGEPLQSHTARWGPRFVRKETPSHRYTDAIQRRAVAFRVVGWRCSGPHLYIDIRYSRFEERHSYIDYVKGGGSMRPLPGMPIVTNWRPVP